MKSKEKRWLFWVFWIWGFAAWAQDAKVLVVAPKGEDFQKAVHALKTNLYDFDVLNVVVDRSEENTVLEKTMTDYSPQVVVLMDNRGIRQYKAFLNRKTQYQKIPVIALMALQLHSVLSDMPQSLGISYELPAVTMITRLREVVRVPVYKVGVVYRKSMKNFYLQNRKYCQIEKIDLKGVEVDDHVSISELRKSLRYLLKKEQIDALWVINDNRLLNRQTLVKVWLPEVQANPLPVIVGVESLIQTHLNFGMYAAVPDPEGLGAQAANLIYDVMENQWNVPEHRVDQPLSVIVILNSTVARQMTTLTPDAFKKVDKLVE